MSAFHEQGSDTPIAKVIASLEAAGKKLVRSGAGWMAQCPGHDDQNPSLSISEGSDGRVLVHCHAGCKQEDVVALLGVPISDLFDLPSRKGKGGAGARRPRELVAIYEYTDAAGNPVSRTLRYDPKGFTQEFFVGSKWVKRMPSGHERQ